MRNDFMSVRGIKRGGGGGMQNITMTFQRSRCWVEESWGNKSRKKNMFPKKSASYGTAIASRVHQKSMEVQFVTSQGHRVARLSTHPVTLEKKETAMSGYPRRINNTRLSRSTIDRGTRWHFLASFFSLDEGAP